MNEKEMVIGLFPTYSINPQSVRKEVDKCKISHSR